MSIDLPPGAKATFNYTIKDELYAAMDRWLDLKPRSPGLHASDLLDPRHSYWDRVHPLPRTKDQIGHFTFGKIGEAFIICLGEVRIEIDPWAGGLQQTSAEFGIDFAPDWEIHGQPVEIKTKRSLTIDISRETIRYYEEQCYIYMTLMNRLDYLLLIVYPNAQDPKTRKINTDCVCVEFTMTPEDLIFMKNQLRKKIHHVKKCFDQNLPKFLPVCREWKCGPKMCGHWEVCQPEGRYGKLYRDWDKPEDIEMLGG